jgi:homoserine O-acetyltransferase
MQALQWSIDCPNLVKKIVVIAAAAKLSAQNIAFNEIARQAILADPNYDAEDKLPKTGLGLARMLGHITYLSDDAMREKFGRDMKKGEVNFSYDVEFEVESYLRYQGESFSNRFDAHTYLLMTKVLDYFDPAQSHAGDLAKTLKSVTAKTLLIAFSSDWRFSPERSRELANAFIEAKKDVSFLEIDSPHGHDAFLMPSETYDSAIETFLEKHE